MKILVLGASSFTGRHFCEYARNQGAEVIGHSLRQGVPFEDWSSDYVVNFAALNVVAPSWQYPMSYGVFNYINLNALIDQMAAKTKRYVHISTPEVYGNTTGFIREDAPYNPSTPYAVSRAAAEMLLACYHRQYNFPVVFTRSCNVYGPGQQLYRLIPKLIVSIKKGQRFPLEGGGTSSRAFLHVSDACAAIWTVLTEGRDGEAYNVSRLASSSIHGVAAMVCEILGVSLADVTQDTPARPGQDAGYFLNDDKIRSLGWSDRINLREGIKSVIDWVDAEWDQLKDASLEYVHR